MRPRLAREAGREYAALTYYSARSHPAHHATLRPKDAQTCQSTNPAVTVSVYYYGDSSACTFAWNADWGDGHNSTNLVVTDPLNGWRVLTQHTYSTPGTYAILITGQVTAGNCTANDLSRTFTLTNPPPTNVYAPVIHWSRTSGKPGTHLTLTGKGWAPGGTVQAHLPSKGFFAGKSSWKVNSQGGWEQRLLTVADTRPGKYKLSFSESSGHLQVQGKFKVAAAHNDGQDRSRCEHGSCTIALDHRSTRGARSSILSGTPVKGPSYPDNSDVHILSRPGSLGLSYLRS